jgi:hypothetical protein
MDKSESPAARNAYGPFTRRMIGEEMLGALHAIVAILLFKEGWTILAWVFVARAVVDEISAIKFALKAQKQEPDAERKARQP